MIRIAIVSTLVAGLVTLLAAPGQAQPRTLRATPLPGAAVVQQAPVGSLPNGLPRSGPGLSGMGSPLGSPLGSPGSLAMLNPQPLPPRYRLLRER